MKELLTWLSFTGNCRSGGSAPFTNVSLLFTSETAGNGLASTLTSLGNLTSVLNSLTSTSGEGCAGLVMASPTVWQSPNTWNALLGLIGRRSGVGGGRSETLWGREWDSLWGREGGSDLIGWGGFRDCFLFSSCCLSRAAFSSACF